MAKPLKLKTIPYDPGQKEELLTLLDSKPFKREIWDWQFQENPLVETFNPVVLVDKWDTIIGFNGEMPVRIKYGDEIIRGLWSCDFFVDTRYHRKGCGKAIKEELHTHSPLIMALGISDMAAPVLLRMGWRENNIVESFRRLNRIPDLKSGLLTSLLLLKRLLTRNKMFQKADIKHVFSDSLPEADHVNHLWNTVATGYNRIVVRDYDYLHWRYENHPLAKYQYINAWQNGELVALIVIRMTGSNATLVDYIGPSRDYALKATLLEEFMAFTKRLDFQACTTSDHEWKKLLQESGFYKQPGNLRFYIYSNVENNSEPASDWFIMGGDSDGDLLKAGEEGPYKYDYLKDTDSQSNLNIKTLSETQFFQLEKDWDKLVEDSDADALFLGWKWQSLWWKQWGKKNKFDLYLLSAYTKDNELIGLAPLYKTRKRLHPLYNFTQIQFIGSTWGGMETVRTEYLDFIVNRRYAYVVRQAFLKYLDGDNSWGQFIFSDLNRQSLTCKLLAQKFNFSNDYSRVVQNDMGVVIDVSKPFSEYLKSLGRNTRYNAFNKRKYMENFGEIKLANADNRTVDKALQLLNDFHMTRWGRPCFPRESLSFHIKLAKAFSRENKLRLSLLSLSDKPISVLYDIRENGRDYNIQAGFDTSIDRKLMPGFLHLGYAIQSAFESGNIREFDLLAGPGKKTFYKSHFGSRKVEFITEQINRTRYMKSIYKVYDLLPLFLKYIVSLRFLPKINIRTD